VVYGALDYASGQLVWQVSAHKNSEAFVSFLDHVAATWPEAPLLLVLDNVGYHKSRLATAWWTAHRERVFPFWLPAYSPQLNLIERAWRFLKEKLSCHRWWYDLDRLQQATASILAGMRARFHTAPGPSITLAQNFCEVA
jgi:transposase